jgi:hypothetical protein
MRLCRTLFVCIKYFAKCLCPRCLVEKEDVHKMGSKLDLKNRVTMMRIDDDHRRGKVNRVREWIYEKGMVLTSTFIKNQLGPESLVPIRVSIFIFTVLHRADGYFI